MMLTLMTLLQIDGGILESVNNLYSLIGLVVLSIVYIIAMIYNKKQDKKKNKDIIDSFEEQNDNIIKKIEELRENKNILDAQASMDIINVMMTKSMLTVMHGVKKIISSDLLEQKSLYIPKKSIVAEKVKNIIDTQIKDDIIVLSRIYHNNVKISHYILEIDTVDLVNEITHIIFSLTDKNDKDVMDYIENRFSQIIQSIELQLSK